MIEINEEINERNIEIFAKNGTDNPYELRHNCCLCGKPTCVGSSYSKQGDRLICWNCQQTKFRDAADMIKWVHGGEQEQK